MVVINSSSDDNVEPICPGKVLNNIIHKHGNLNLMVNSMEKKMVTLMIPATLAIMKLITYQLSTSGIFKQIIVSGMLRDSSGIVICLKRPPIFIN